jgi:lysophospholipase L1-like esterase
MTPERRFLIVALGAWTVLPFAACGGSKTGPTPNAPQITCPAAPDPVESLDGSAQVVSFPAPTVTGGQAPLTTSCAPVTGSSFTIGTTTVTCSTSDADARTASCSFKVVVLPQPVLSVRSFVAFGDSITWGEDGTNTASAVGQHVFVQLPQGQRYPDILQQELQARYQQQQVSVQNAGCPGEFLNTLPANTPEFNDKCYGIRQDDPSAVRRFTTIASLHQFDAVLFMEGSNDVNMAAGDSLVLGSAIGSLRTMIDTAKGTGLRVIVATIPPMVPPGIPDRTVGAAIVPTYNDMVRALAAIRVRSAR